MDSPEPSLPANADSSPVAETWLSPRTKLNALLATVDTSDEEAGTSSNSVEDKKGPPAAKSLTINRFQRSISSQELDSSDEDGIVQPRGRVAARMQAKKNGEDLLDHQGQQDARERVRAMLNAEKDEQESTDPAPPSRPVQAGTGNSSEEDIAPRAHKRLARKERSKTAEGQISPQAGSPSLFISPAAEGSVHDSNDDLPATSFKNARFQALVAKKREERQARDADEERKKAARIFAQQQQQEAFSDIVSSDESDRMTDDEGGRKLTQEASRPAARKASRKALEEMNRETQRMTRQLQLAHEAKTRKKITKASLFERFNFRLAVEESPEANLVAGASSSRPATPISAHQTDIEMRDGETPPSSPPSALAPRIEEGKGKAIATETNVVQAAAGTAIKATASLRVKLPEIVANPVTVESESDDELQITETKPDKVDAIFSRLPTIKAREPTAIRSLRRLAHLDSPERKVTTARKDDKHGMTAAELQMSLQQRARLQAKLERDRRLELLKSKGIHVQTVEEKEREAAQVEDIVAAARKEAEDIMLREKEVARREKRERGENAESQADPLAWDDSEDDDGEYKALAEVSDIEISGTEDEAEGDGEKEQEDASGSDEDADEKADAEEEDGGNGGLIDDEAGSAEESTDEDVEDGFDDGDDDVAEAESIKLRVRESRRKTTAVISDDEDMPEVEKTPRPKPFATSPVVNSDSPKVPTSVLRSATKTFIPGLPVPLAAPAGLGLTQIFAGTMDDSQTDAASGVPHEPMPTFDNFPDSQFSIIATRESANGVIMDSQEEMQNLDAQQDGTQAVQLHISQSEGPEFGSLLRRESTQLSDMIQATQDEGFHNYTPLKERFVEPPPSTVQTVILETVETATKSVVQETPVVPKRGRLRRRADMTQVPDNGDEADVSDAAEVEIELEEDEFGFGTTDAFKKLQTAKKRLGTVEYDKTKSKAKDMVDEQAEESEDEYAGLGGVDGEDSDDSDAASVKEMIDDDSKDTDMNKAELAAFYAYVFPEVPLRDTCADAHLSATVTVNALATRSK
jgi:mediator of replication checkpoint protein 1